MSYPAHSIILWVGKDPDEKGHYRIAYVTGKKSQSGFVETIDLANRGTDNPVMKLTYSCLSYDWKVIYQPEKAEGGR